MIASNEPFKGLVRKYYCAPCVGIRGNKVMGLSQRNTDPATLPITSDSPMLKVLQRFTGRQVHTGSVRQIRFRSYKMSESVPQIIQEAQKPSFVTEHAAKGQSLFTGGFKMKVYGVAFLGEGEPDTAIEGVGEDLSELKELAGPASELIWQSETDYELVPFFATRKSSGPLTAEDLVNEAGLNTAVWNSNREEVLRMGDPGSVDGFLVDRLRRWNGSDADGEIECIRDFVLSKSDCMAVWLGKGICNPALLMFAGTGKSGHIVGFLTGAVET